MRAGATHDDVRNSGLGEVARQLAFEFGKVTGDHRDVEMPQDRLLGLAVKQELERSFDAVLRRMRAHRQSFAAIPRQSDVMAGLAISCTDDDLESKLVAIADSVDLDHGLSSQLISSFDEDHTTSAGGSKVAKPRTD